MIHLDKATVPAKKLFCLIVVIGACMAIGDVAPRAQAPVDRTNTRVLPDGEGKDLVLGACVQCHALTEVTMQRKTPEKWQTTIRDMVSRGAQVKPDEIEIISSYLAQHFKPGADIAPASAKESGASATPNQTASTLPDGEGKNMILAKCTECHYLTAITYKRKSIEGWIATVRNMVKLGASVTPQEQELIVEYLSKNLGPADLKAAKADKGNVGLPAKSKEPDTVPSAKPGSAQTVSLPDGAGKNLILASCVECHGLQEILGLRKNARGWKQTVDDMVSRGAQVTTIEAQAIVEYLAANFGN